MSSPFAAADSMRSVDSLWSWSPTRVTGDSESLDSTSDLETASDRTQFNYSEILGTSTAVAISNAYYPDNRKVTDAVTKPGTQIGVDVASSVPEEFWPDVSRRFSRKDRQ